MKNAVFAIFFIISFCLPLTTFAQDLEKNWELGISGGYYGGTETEDGMLRIRDPRIKSFERNLGTYESSLDGDPIFYINAGYRFKDYGFFRLQVGYTEFDIDIDRNIYAQPDENIIGTLETIPVVMNFNYFLMRKTPFKPYVSIGFTSYVFIDSQEINISPSIKLGGDFGVGLEYYFTDSFAVNFDVGYHFLKIEVEGEEPFTGRGYPQTYEEINVLPVRAEAALGIKFLVF